MENGATPGYDPKGLIVEIFRTKNYSDAPMNFFNQKETLTLVGENIDRVFEPNIDRPAVKIVLRKLSHCDYLTAYPVDSEGNVIKGGMFGGSFIYSSDARFRQLSAYPVPLHDRFE
jgi:hypothetical protein